mmetsp:Transcript_164797/g.528738  ORF Transcript_164797/g.528738 Transcript_164797/m.528738 type:complete len:199 (-) Transcript_164797:40-636(-)
MRPRTQFARGLRTFTHWPVLSSPATRPATLSRRIRVRFQVDAAASNLALDDTQSDSSSKLRIQKYAVAAPDPLRYLSRVHTSNIRVVVGAPGGALAFIAFLPTHAALVELSPPGWQEQCRPGWNRNPHSLWGQWCSLAQLEHKCLMGEIGIARGTAGALVMDVLLQGNVSVSQETIVDAVLEALGKVRAPVAEAAARA